MNSIARRRCLTGAVILLAAGVAGAALRAGEIVPPLSDRLDEAGPADLVPVSIVMARQVGPAEIAALSVGSREARREAIATRLREEASSTQGELLGFLEAESRRGAAARVRPLWISNVIGAKLTPLLARAVAARADVASVRWAGPVDAIEEPNTEGPAEAINRDYLEPIECGVRRLRADEVWNRLNLTGVGVTVAVIDTGTCVLHPDIVDQVWVNPGEDLDGDVDILDADDLNGVDDDGNGFVDDLVGWDFVNDDHDPDVEDNHGSHVTGSVSGDGTEGTVSGVAPGARVMLLKFCYPCDEISTLSAVQYAVDNGADVLSMSFGFGEAADRVTWRNTLENAIAMGVVAVASAGNTGSGNEPQNISSPGDVPGVITVGASDCADQVPDWSSRGPVTWQDVPPWNDWPYPPGLVKPDVAAPGVAIKSHDRCDGYGIDSGTSAATPHVSGAVALLLSGNPELSPGQLKDALETTAVDLLDPGKDNDSGSGRVDAFAAVSSVAGKLVVQSRTLDDSDPDYGNGDGDADPGETVTLRLTLENRGAAPATNVRAILTSVDRRAEVLDGWASFPDLTAGGTATSEAPHLTFRVREACGRKARLRIELRHDDGEQSHGGLAVRVGFRQETDHFLDDMETDLGWTTGGDEVEGRFVREDPRQAMYFDQISQPEDDATVDPAALCWVTGNSPSPYPFGEVDGLALLTSPRIDVSGPGTLVLQLSRWVFLLHQVEETSHYELQISSDDGAGWTVLERMDFWHAPFWFRQSFQPGLSPTSQMRLRVEAAEENPFPGDTPVEVLIDDVRLYSRTDVCETVIEPAALPPNPVGATLLVDKHPDGLTLGWTAPSPDAEHDPATFYRLYRSGSPAGGFTVHRETTDIVLLEPTELALPATRYYVVASRNGGGTSGEEPVP